MYLGHAYIIANDELLALNAVINYIYNKGNIIGGGTGYAN